MYLTAYFILMGAAFLAVRGLNALIGHNPNAVHDNARNKAAARRYAAARAIPNQSNAKPIKWTAQPQPLTAAQKAAQANQGNAKPTKWR